MIINSHLNEFKGNINAQFNTFMWIQIKIHRLIFSSFSPIDNLTIKEVTKILIATKESTEFYQVCNDNIKKYFEKNSSTSQ